LSPACAATDSDECHPEPLCRCAIDRPGLEAIEAGQHVIVGLRGPGFNGTLGDLETVGQVFNVFTLSDGKAVHWRDFLTRREALAANAEDQPWQ
jgi:hypothetical protein